MHGIHYAEPFRTHARRRKQGGWYCLTNGVAVGELLRSAYLMLYEAAMWRTARGCNRSPLASLSFSGREAIGVYEVVLGQKRFAFFSKVCYSVRVHVRQAERLKTTGAYMGMTGFDGNVSRAGEPSVNSLTHTHRTANFKVAAAPRALAYA